MLKNLGLATLSLCVTLLLMEGAVRLYNLSQGEPIGPPKDTFITTDDNPKKFDTYLGYVLKPGFASDEIQVNSLGFRSSREFGFDAAGVDHILMLGDSFLFGMGVTQPKIFTELLNARTARQQYVNTGIIGYNTIQEYRALTKFHDVVRPKLVFLLYVQANDMWWNARSDNFSPSVEVVGDGLVIHDATRTIELPLYKRPMLYRFLSNHFLRGRDWAYLINKVDFYSRGERSRPWRITRMLLGDVGDHSREHSYRVVVIDVPTRKQAKDPSESRKRQELVRAAAMEEGFFYFDLLDDYPADYPKLFLDDGHWNEEGHRFVADFIAQISDELL